MNDAVSVVWAIGSRLWLLCNSISTGACFQTFTARDRLTCPSNFEIGSSVSTSQGKLNSNHQKHRYPETTECDIATSSTFFGHRMAANDGLAVLWFRGVGVWVCRLASQPLVLAGSIRDYTCRRDYQCALSRSSSCARVIPKYGEQSWLAACIHMCSLYTAYYVRIDGNFVTLTSAWINCGVRVKVSTTEMAMNSASKLCFSTSWRTLQAIFRL